MAQQQQQEGWPLGLQPLHVRVGLAASNHEFSGSVSFNTLLTGSPTSSTDSSSDLDTELLAPTVKDAYALNGVNDNLDDDRVKWGVETSVKGARSVTLISKDISTGSFFHDRSITLGSLIGINNILELSRRSLRGRKTDHQAGKDRKANNNNTTTKFRLCFFSFCSKDSTDGENVRNHPPSLGHFLAAERQAANENYRTNPPIYGPDDELVLAEHHQPARESNNSLFVDGQVAPPQSSPRFGSDHVDQRKSMLFPCMC